MFSFLLLQVSVKLLEILERPLLGPEGDAWKNVPRGMSLEHEQWIDAQIYSEKASDKYRNLEPLVYPLDKTQDQATLDDLWKLVNFVSDLHSCNCVKKLMTLIAQRTTRLYRAWASTRYGT